MSELSVEDKEKILKKRLDRLSMCKRGQIRSDIKRQTKAKIGKAPTFSALQKGLIVREHLPKIKRMLTPSHDDIMESMKYDTRYSVISSSNLLEDFFEEVCEEINELLLPLMVHPDKAQWVLDKAALERQESEREATLDGAVSDIISNFLLGITKPEQMPAILTAFEAEEF